jgi:hypothetical protein
LPGVKVTYWWGSGQVGTVTGRAAPSRAARGEDDSTWEQSGFAVRPDQGHRSNLYGTIRAEPGGGYRLSTGHEDDPGLVLRDDNERAEFVAYLVERYCNERYPSMEAWEERRHASYGADLHDWVSEPPGPHPQSSTSPPPRPSPN